MWHKGRFATIGVTYNWRSEYLEIRKENETITTSGGRRMEDALATACTLLAQDLDAPQPPKPERLRLQMSKYMERP